MLGKLINFTDDQIDQIEKYQHDNKIGSFTEAVRDMVSVAACLQTGDVLITPRTPDKTAYYANKFLEFREVSGYMRYELFAKQWLRGHEKSQALAYRWKVRKYLEAHHGVTPA